MARVLFVVPVGQDMGGIITSTEQYVAGLREAGHDVTPICAVFTQRDAPTGPAPRGKFGDDYVPGPGTGWLLHPTAGWRSEYRVSMVAPEGIARFNALVKKADVVIWASMYGFRNDATEGTTDWLAPIKAGKGKNVFMIHDDHLPERYPWAGALAPWAAAFVGVQPCSFDSLRSVTAPRSMVYTPLPKPPRLVAPMADRSGFASIQVWKTWKRADALVAAAPFMPRKTVLFGGDGIQLRYMKSLDKCPPRYAGLWAAAMKKQDYAGVLAEVDRDRHLGQRKFLVDLSLRHNSGQLNRIVQEAMAQGCVVIANPDFISGGWDNPDAMFVRNKHYVAIQTELYDDPKALAKWLLELDRSMSAAEYAGYQKAARSLLGEFDRIKLANELVQIGLGKPGGLGYTAVRSTPPKAAVEAFVKVFGGKP